MRHFYEYVNRNIVYVIYRHFKLVCYYGIYAKHSKRGKLHYFNDIEKLWDMDSSIRLILSLPSFPRKQKKSRLCISIQSTLCKGLI